MSDEIELWPTIQSAALYTSFLGLGFAMAAKLLQAQIRGALVGRLRITTMMQSEMDPAVEAAIDSMELAGVFSWVGLAIFALGACAVVALEWRYASDD